MLDVIDTRTGKTGQTRKTQIRHDDKLAMLIQHASEVLGVNKTEFLRHAITKEANRIIEDNSCHVLTPEDEKLFLAALNKPPAPTPHALESADSYRRRVVYAD